MIRVWRFSGRLLKGPADTAEANHGAEVGTGKWGELHGLAGDGPAAKTYMMIYSPRDARELAVTKRILEAAVRYARHVAR